jgi:hypothetical protein
MAVLRWVVDVLARIDPGLWYLVDLRRRSALSWVPVALMVALLVFGAMECLLAGNFAGGVILSALALMLFYVKLLASALAQARR